MAVAVKPQTESRAYRMRVETALLPLLRRQAELEKKLSSVERRPPADRTQLDIAVATRQRVREVTAQIADQLTLLEGIQEEVRRVEQAQVEQSRKAEPVRRVEPSTSQPQPVVKEPAGATDISDVTVEELHEASDAMGAEITRVRNEILDTLRSLAGSLRRYEQLAAHKTELSRRLAAATGKDQAYANYIECALLRQPEFEGELRYVVELLKRQHVAS